MIGSNAHRNLKGKAKLRAIREEVGTDFVYAGDSYADLPIWQASASDLAVLWPLGLGSALCSVVVFGLFITAVETQGRYGTPELLRAVAVGLIYWLARLWITTARGEMHDDPVVYAVKDGGSRTTVLLMVIAVLVSHYWVLPYP